MFFTLLVFGAALTLELFGSYISIMGLSKNASYILVGLAITLDFAKIIIATVLYKQWKNLHGFLKYTLIPPLIFLIIFTSSGAYAFLIQEFSKTTTGQEQAQTRIEALEQEKVKLESRKKEIDGQIAKLPPESVVQRRRLTELFAKEMEHINTRTIEMDKEIPELKIKNMADTTQGGTIGSIAKAYNVSAESITKVLVFPLVLVIDPLAIILLTVANFLVEQRKKEKKDALNKQLEIEALMAAEAKNKPPAPIPAPTVAPVVAPVVPDPPPIPPISTPVPPVIETPVNPPIVPAEVPVAQPVAQVIAPPVHINPPVQAVVEPVIESVVEPVMVPVEAPKNNSWMMPFGNPISLWKNKAAPVVAEPAIEDVMAELSNLEAPEPIPVETVVVPEVIEDTPELPIENIETVEVPQEAEVTEHILDSIEDIYDDAPEYEIVTPAPQIEENNDLASEEEVKMALAELEDNSFQESSDPADLIQEEPEEIVEVISEAEEMQEPEEDMFAEVDEALEKAQEVPEVKVVEAPKRTFTFPRPSSSDLTEQINDDIFDNYEVSDSEIMQVMGVTEKDKGFDTAKVLEEDLF